MSLFERFSTPHAAVLLAAERLACGDTSVAVSGPAEAQAALQECLTKRKGARVRVMLAHELLHFTTVPWSDALLAPREAEAYLRAAFEASLGEGANELRITSEHRPVGQTRVACGVAGAWIDAVEHATRAAGAHLEWLGPWMTRAWESHRARVIEPEGWWVATEPGGFCIAFVRGGRVSDVCVFPGEASTRAIERQINRLALREGIDRALPVWVADAAAACGDARAEWKMLPWRTPTPPDWAHRILGLAA